MSIGIRRIYSGVNKISGVNFKLMARGLRESAKIIKEIADRFIILI